VYNPFHTSAASNLIEYFNYVIRKVSVSQLSEMKCFSSDMKSCCITNLTQRQTTLKIQILA